MNRIAVVQRALAGAGEAHAKWKFDLIALRFELRTLLSKAEQEFGPASAQEVQAELTVDAAKEAKIQSLLEKFRNEQAHAASFALADAYVSASVRLRKAEEGLMAHDVPRYYKTYSQPNNVDGYNAGLLLRVLRPSASSGETLAVHVPGAGDKSFMLPEGKPMMYAFLPFMKATRNPLYHLRGSATLTLDAGGTQRKLKRSIDLQRELLNDWSIVGPFSRGKAPELGEQPVTAAMLGNSYIGKDGKRVSWTTWRDAPRHRSKGLDYLQNMMPWIDLYTIYPKDHAEAVAVTWVDAPRAVRVSLRVRHDASIAVWVNGDKVMDVTGPKGVTDLTDPPPGARVVSLKKGWNQIAVRTDDETKDWGFALRLGLPPGMICAQSDKPPAGLKAN